VFFVALLALWFPGEPVGRHRLLAVLGFALFGELPDGNTLLGAAIIVCSSGYMMMRKAKIRTPGQNAAKPAPPSRYH
jgi:drug/metabolite transporter (DMT)-like permease